LSEIVFLKRVRNSRTLWKKGKKRSFSNYIKI